MKNLMQRAEYSFRPSVCHCCGAAVALTEKRTINPSASKSAKIYLCVNSVCNAYVGCKPGTDVAIGSLATQATRLARNKAQASMRALVDSKLLGTERDSYEWMFQIMSLPHNRHGISWLRNNECKKLVDEINFFMSQARMELGRKNISKLRCMFVKDTNTTKKPEPKIDSAFQAITAVVRMLGGSENASY